MFATPAVVKTSPIRTPIEIKIISDCYKYWLTVTYARFHLPQKTGQLRTVDRTQLSCIGGFHPATGHEGRVEV
jgi:hypothetical protein